MPCKIMKKNCGSGTSNKIKTRLACILEAQWIYKNACGIFDTASSWRPYCSKRKQFTTALQFGSQKYSYASSYENSCSKGSSGQGMGKIGENFRVEPDNSDMSASRGAHRVNTTPHTSIFSQWITCTRMAQVWVRTRFITSMFHVSSGVSFWLFSLRRLHFLLFPHDLLSYHLVLPSAHQLHLPGRGGQIPCALPLMRTLAPLPSTTLSQVMSPTTTTSQRLLNHTPRNPRSRMGPRMTSSTMTSPSARRSLHHCSPKSEKMQRAVDEPITLKKKVCRPVCRRPSVMIERGDPLWNRLTQKIFKCSRNSEPQLRKWANQDSSGTTKRADFRWLSSRDSKTRIPGRLWQKKYSKVEWNDPISRRKQFVVLIKETNDFDEIINFFMNSYQAKLDLREAHDKSLSEMEELKRFQSSTFDTIARR